VITQGKTLEDAVTDALAGQKSMVQCPSHEDTTPSLSVAPGKDHPVLLHCHAGCEPDKIIADGGLDWATVMAPEDPDAHTAPTHMWTPRGTASHIYRYTDLRGQVLYEVLRVPLPGGKKTIIQRQPDESTKSGYVWNLDGVERVLYRLPEVIVTPWPLATPSTSPRARSAPTLCRRCWVKGRWPRATRWRRQVADRLLRDAVRGQRGHLRGRRRTRSGPRSRGARRTCSRRLHCQVGRRHRRAPSPARGKVINDVADHLEAGQGLDALLETTPRWIERARTGIDVLDLIKRTQGADRVRHRRHLRQG
jgi:hypothetical protein